jgi:hypothetical protein
VVIEKNSAATLAALRIGSDSLSPSLADLGHFLQPESGASGLCA